MFHRLASLNDDLRRLLEKGYAITVDTNHLVIRDVPYLDAGGELRIGAIVTALSFIDQDRVAQQNHQVFFAGGMPHGLDGRPIPNLGDSAAKVPLSEACSDVVVERAFSNKPFPSGKFADFFDKVESYVAIISGPAMERFDATPYTFRSVETAETKSVFKFHDTLTSRAEISDLSVVFEDEVIAIFGLGGTGAYLLDFMVKTPVKEVRGYDGDDFHVHTAYRSPGHLEPAEFGQKKAEVYQARYENFRHGLDLVAEYATSSSAANLDGVTFAFVCVDQGPARAEIFDLLMAKGIPFIDVGMGLQRQGAGLDGLVRMTYFPADMAMDVRAQHLAEEHQSPENLYKANIQISELNALNACLAVVRYKQLRGFYVAANSSYHLLLGIGDLKTATLDRDPD